MSDWNAGVIAEFRKNHGKVGGNFEGTPLLLINHKVARTGKPRTNPDWYHNLKAHPDVKIEVGNETIDVRAEEIIGAERDRLYKKQASLYPQFAQYQQKTKRTIPIMAFTPKTRR